MRFCDVEFFSEKKAAGSSFHVYVMQVHTRTEWVNVPDLEKMLESREESDMRSLGRYAHPWNRFSSVEFLWQSALSFL